MTPWATPLVVAHGFADAAPFPVPAPIVLLGGGAVVAAAAAVSSQHTRPLPALARTLGPLPTLLLRLIAVVVGLGILLPAALGRTDIAANPAPGLLFTVGWAGLLLVSALVGPIWARANPLRWAAAPDERGRRLHLRAGMWPAVIALVLFSAAELVASPSTTLVLIVVTVYVLGSAAGALRFGNHWFRAVDPIEAASRLLGRLAPVGRAGGRVAARRVRAGVAGTTSVAGMAAFLGVLIAASVYDALAPGGPVAGRLGVFAFVIAAGGGLATAAARPAALAPALIPAAAGHAAAHYLAPLLVETQIAAIQASDPFGSGWNLLGLTGSDINPEPVPAVVGQVVQLIVLLAGHGLAMVVANDIAARRVGPRGVAATLFPLRAVILLSAVAGLYLRLVA